SREPLKETDIITLVLDSARTDMLRVMMKEEGAVLRALSVRVFFLFQKKCIENVRRFGFLLVDSMQIYREPLIKFRFLFTVWFSTPLELT
ncbi:MAG: hypothetical protein M3R27_11205, partial [Bacteroidota bacterium]|nr:hypothetical protein [Bacteroidota bacterium]